LEGPGEPVEAVEAALTALQMVSDNFAASADGISGARGAPHQYPVDPGSRNHGSELTDDWGDLNAYDFFIF